MAVDEERRFRLHQRLEEVLGPEVATVLMEHLPPVGWADVATKHDLAALEGRIGLKFDLVDARFDLVDARFDLVDARFEQVDLRFDHLEERLGGLEGRFDSLAASVDRRFERMDSRFDRAQAELRTYFVTLVAMIVASFGSMVALIKL